MASLTDDQHRAWRALLEMTQAIEVALEAQAQRDGGIPHAHYRLLVDLFEAPGATRSMGELADRLRHSPSRLTHAVTSMEKRGVLRRTRSALDRRVQLVELTDAGVRLVRRVSPRQALEVRAPVFAALTADEVDRLEAIATTVVGALGDRR